MAHRGRPLALAEDKNIGTQSPENSQFLQAIPGVLTTMKVISPFALDVSRTFKHRLLSTGYRHLIKLLILGLIFRENGLFGGGGGFVFQYFCPPRDRGNQGLRSFITSVYRLSLLVRMFSKINNFLSPPRVSPDISLRRSRLSSNNTGIYQPCQKSEQFCRNSQCHLISTSCCRTGI